MRYALYVVLLVALALLVPLGAVAQSKSERNVVLTDTVQVGSTQLKPGTYKVEWQGTGSSLRVSFLEHGKTVVTTEGKMVELKEPSPYDDVVTTGTGNTRRLEEIDFSGKRDALVLVPTETGMK
jgi:hypothetical protein